MTPDTPNPDPYALARAAMVRDQIQARGVTDPRVLDAMRRIPRERFVDADIRDQAYEDRALGIGDGQTISQPYIVAVMSARLDLHPLHHVLEIGTGSGYQTAVLALLAESVYTIERIPAFTETARRRLDGLGLSNIQYRCGDGSLGWPEEAPFDRIVVTAAAPAAPPALIQQLADGGILVLPIGSQKHQTLTTVTKDATGLRTERILDCRFVRLVGAQGWP